MVDDKTKQTVLNFIHPVTVMSDVTIYLDFICGLRNDPYADEVTMSGISPQPSSLF